MKSIKTSTAILALFLLTSLAGTAGADPKKSHGAGKHRNQDAHESRSHDYGDAEDDDQQYHQRDDYHQHRDYFNDQHRTIVHHYYVEEFDHGHCPPGLRKKHNGCMPPGLAKQWRLGEPLARDVVYYDLPPAIVVQLGPPPIGHRYVRVASDILLIAVGTGMVLDAIADLSAM